MLDKYINDAIMTFRSGLRNCRSTHGAQPAEAGAGGNRRDTRIHTGDETGFLLARHNSTWIRR
jgi:hypothetical protein